MPLHDWSNDRGWDSVCVPWISELVRWLRPRLPEGFRAYAGAVPFIALEPRPGRADVSGRAWPVVEPMVPQSGQVVTADQPDVEAVGTFTTEPQFAVQVVREGQVIAAIELVSPRNKDRPDSREQYFTRYAGYLRQGIHLLLVDVLPRPLGFSFATRIADGLGLTLPPCPAPFAATFRVGEAVPEGTLLAAWQRPLRPGDPLPVLPLPLDVHRAVPVDLEATYAAAAELAYLQ